MIKNRKIQLVYLTAACTVGFFAIPASMGLFEAAFRWDFYIYFTNLSNYFCFAVMLAQLVQVLRSKEDGPIDALPLLKFMGLVVIVLTFLMFNVTLAPSKSTAYLLSFRNISLHVLLPVLYVSDWFLFYERKKTTWKYPLFSLAFPAAYLVFLFLHAAALRFDASILCFAKNAPLIYPYFFLNYSNLGVQGLIMWLTILLFALLAVGYLFFLLDRLCLKKTRSS